MLPQVINHGYCQNSQYGRNEIGVIITRQNPVKPMIILINLDDSIL